jgi:hypothetical protein
MIIGNHTGMAAADVEEVRQEYLHQIEGNSSDDRPGSFSCHELLDRTHLIANQLDDWLLSHPACVNNPAWFAFAYQAMDQLQRLYQAIGASHLTPEPKESNGAARSS